MYVGNSEGTVHESSCCAMKFGGTITIQAERMPKPCRISWHAVTFPQVLSGKVIGFRGANIKAIESETGCFVRLEARSNLSKMYNSREVQMAGPPAALGAAVVRVLQASTCACMHRMEHAGHPLSLVVSTPGP